MIRNEFNTFCATLAATNPVVQWGGADVRKAGGKLFAIGGRADGQPGVRLRCSPPAFQGQAPYLASRGLKWLLHHAASGLNDAELREHVRPAT